MLGCFAIQCLGLRKAPKDHFGRGLDSGSVIEPGGDSLVELVIFGRHGRHRALATGIEATLLLLEWLDPLAVEDILYGHPNRAVLRSLAAHGAVTLRTDLDGSIVVRTDGRGIEVEAAGERWTLAK